MLSAPAGGVAGAADSEHRSGQQAWKASKPPTGRKGLKSAGGPGGRGAGGLGRGSGARRSPRRKHTVVGPAWVSCSSAASSTRAGQSDGNVASEALAWSSTTARASSPRARRARSARSIRQQTGEGGGRRAACAAPQHGVPGHGPRGAHVAPAEGQEGAAVEQQCALGLPRLPQQRTQRRAL